LESVLPGVLGFVENEKSGQGLQGEKESTGRIITDRGLPDSEVFRISLDSVFHTEICSSLP
jgi:hypothetical protein